MLFVLSAAIIKPIIALTLIGIAAIAADPLLEQILAGRLKLHAQLQQCHVEVSTQHISSGTLGDANVVDILDTALAKDDLFKPSGFVPTYRLLKDGKRWIWMMCGRMATFDDQLGLLAKDKNDNGSARRRRVSCRLLFADENGLCGGGSGDAVFNMTHGIMAAPQMVTSSLAESNPSPWFATGSYEALGSSFHPVDPVLDAVSETLAGKRSDAEINEEVVDGRRLIKFQFTKVATLEVQNAPGPVTIKSRRTFLLDPERNFATAIVWEDGDSGPTGYSKVVEWFPDRDFPKKAASIGIHESMLPTETKMSRKFGYGSYLVTRADLNSAPDFNKYPIEVAAGAQYSSDRIDPVTQKPLHASDKFRSSRKLTLDELSEVERSLFANPGQGDIAPLKPPTKPSGTSYVVWGLLAAGVACIIAAIWTLRARSR